MLGRIAGACGRSSGRVVAATLVLAMLALLAVWRGLGVSTDTGGLFAASLPWKQRQAQLRAAYPQNEDLLVAVVDGRIPEAADLTAAALAHTLRRDTAHFISVRQPDADPYLARNALLFVDPAPLAALLETTIDAQPFLGKLAADPSLRGLVGALSLVAEGIRRHQASLGPFVPALAAFHRTLTDPAQPLSWERLLGGPLVDMAGRYRFVLAKPVLDYGALQPGAAAARAVRRASERLKFVRSGLARVRITGSVALDDDEFATVAQGAAGGLAGSFALVTLWLLLAVRTWRLIVPILLTLLLGLLLTSAFAALAVGTLNLVSVAFAVLFVGLAVDFAIQFAMRVRESGGAASGIEEAGRRGGGQILVAALATSAGFLAFTPTDFAGVAQLGLIAGVGMLIAFCCTLTVLPALIALLRPPAETAEVGFAWAAPLDAFAVRRRGVFLCAFGALGVLGLLLLPSVRFDSDPLHTKNQATESVRTLNDLVADPVTSPYGIEVLLLSQAAVRALAPHVESLPTVGGVLSLDSLVPDQQSAKLPLLADAAGVLLPTLDAPAVPPPDVASLRAALQGALPDLQSASALLPPGDAFGVLTRDLRALADAPAARLLATQSALTRFLPLQLDRLRTALRATPATRSDIPADLARDWVTPDGSAKLQVLPTQSASHDSAGLHRFVAEVSAAAPGAGGAAVTIVRSADTIIAAFRFAAAAALAAITLILLAALRRLLDTLLVLVPLLLSSLLTVIVTVATPLPLNFANIIALPLLLGVGVSFNVYYVMNWRAGRGAPLRSATTRAILFSALTTATAFGSLALSAHPGTASMGRLLLASLGSTLLATLGFMPALLACFPNGKHLADRPLPPDR